MRSKSVYYTLKDIQGFSTSDISIFEPFIQKEQIFTVVPLSEIVSQNKIGELAEIDKLDLTDQVYSNTAKNFPETDHYIGIARKGKDISFVRGGPMRIILSDESEWAQNLDAWNWYLREILVK
jgi:hypothetical protein